MVTKEGFVLDTPSLVGRWTVNLSVGFMQHIISEFQVHVTVHRDKFLTIKPTRSTNFSNLFSE